jgi:hypothetical protein
MVQHADIDHTGLTGVGVGDATAHIADNADAHDASAISIVDAGTYFTGTDVEAALQELGAGVGGSVATDAIWDAAGDLAVGTGANTAARLAAGATSGHVLTSNGAGVAPSWQAAAGGGGALVLLEQHTASASSSLDFTTFISSTYDTYKIELVDIVAATSTADLRLHFGSGGGPTYDTGNNYQWSADGRASGAAAYTDAGGTGIVRLFQDMNTSANFGFGVASLTLYHPQSASLYKTLLGQAFWTTVSVASGPAAIQASWGVQWYNASAMTALRFIMSSGNIASGTIRAYGVTK